MGSEPHYTPDQIANALREVGGRTAAAGQLLGCSGRTVRNYLYRYPELKELYYDLKDRALDAVEGGLWQKALSGDVTAQIFILKTQGRRRGWSSKTEAVGIDGHVEESNELSIEERRQRLFEILNEAAARNESELELSPDPALSLKERFRQVQVRKQSLADSPDAGGLPRIMHEVD